MSTLLQNVLVQIGDRTMDIRSLPAMDQTRLLGQMIMQNTNRINVTTRSGQTQTVSFIECAQDTCKRVRTEALPDLWRTIAQANNDIMQHRATQSLDVRAETLSDMAQRTRNAETNLIDLHTWG